MKLLRIGLPIVLLLCPILELPLMAAPAPAFQGATNVPNASPVNQVAPRSDVCTTYTPQEASATATATMTLTPTGSTGYVVIYEIDGSNVVGASAVTAATTSTLTTTNISGSPLWVLASGVTAGTLTQYINANFPTGLRSQTPGTAVTFVLPQLKVNQGIHLNVCWSAP